MLLTTFYIDGFSFKSRFQAKEIFTEVCLLLNTLVDEQQESTNDISIRKLVNELKQHIKERYNKTVTITTSKRTHSKCADLRIEYHLD